jgi:hypothetical protein
MFGSLCGIYSGYSSWLIILKRSPHYGSITLDSVLDSVSPKVGGWEKSFFVDVLMTGFALGVFFNCLVVPREEPWLVSSSFILGNLDEHLVIGFIGGIFPTNRA